jgi:hypothetical protein
MRKARFTDGEMVAIFVVRTGAVGILHDALQSQAQAGIGKTLWFST